MLLEEKMLAQKTWAVVGANRDTEKFGNRIYRKLKEKGYTVFAVNPRYDSVEGDPCYPTLSDLPQKPDVVNLVVAPQIGKKIIRQAHDLDISYLWLQPGTYDEELMELIAELKLDAVQACVLVATR